MMNVDVRDRWVIALRSGFYRQGTGTLTAHAGDPRNRADWRFCCLGVLCDLAVSDGVIERVQTGDRFGYGDEHAVALLPDPVVAWAELSGRDPEVDGISLSTRNDGGEYDLLDDDGRVIGLESADRHNFTEIAKLIEEHL